MKGDFSTWKFRPRENLNGVLHQQGRVMRDADLTESDLIALDWQDRAARDIIGAGVCAVPTTEPDGFAIAAARVINGGGGPFIQVSVQSGRAWADGWLVELGGAAAQDFTATYLGPPFNDPVPALPPAVGDRDMVVLELWRQELNAFQALDRLFEPALGGPDTAERIHTQWAFRLVRLADGEDCHTARPRLQEDPATLGRLEVTLAPEPPLAEDCPAVGGGGYTGFEHNLWRIEIAATDAGTWFKTSGQNGGLVGRGTYHTQGPDRWFSITHNLNAIVRSGRADFYLEVVVFDAALGHWRVQHGARVQLQADHTLRVVGAPLLDNAAGLGPAASVFFRLWDEVRDLTQFVAAGGTHLVDGIQFAFDAPGPGRRFRAGDAWTFEVRAGEIDNATPLLTAQPPTSPAYRRVPLAEITWGNTFDTATSGELEDCRHRFRALTQLDTCCTWRVGDGVRSRGDFTSIQAAINALPARGGEVCILPGVYEQNVTLRGRRHVTLSGCGPRTLLRSRPPREGATAEPVIFVEGGEDITIESLAIEAHPAGAGIVLQGGIAIDRGDLGPLHQVVLRDLLVLGGEQAAVRARLVLGLGITACALHQRDTACAEHTLVVQASDVLIAENLVEIAARGGGLAGEPGGAYSAPPYLAPGSVALGGIHLEGLSERVRLIDNLVRGGSGHGITLGSFQLYDDDDQPADDLRRPRRPLHPLDPCEPGQPVPPVIDVEDPEDGGHWRADGPIEELLIERNRIHDMGTCGIGVVGFFDLRMVRSFVTVRRLAILGNDIRRNLRRAVAEAHTAITNSAGLGGISLAEVEDLVVRDNFIERNGRSHVDPVCGVFVLHVAGAEFSRNRIVENGALDSAAGDNPRRGVRGGIVLVYAIAPMGGVERYERAMLARGRARLSGTPAVTVHDNVVSAPLGPALLMNALGPVSVLGNHLSSHGAAPGFFSSFLAATVSILNLGKASKGAYFAYADSTHWAPAANTNLAGIDAYERFAKRDVWTGGNVLFAGNQVTLLLHGQGFDLALSSVLIASADDVGFHDNQCVASLAGDLLLAQVVVAASTVRLTDNRLTETGETALLSGLTLGQMMNTTSQNHGTHCLVALSPRLIAFLNITLTGGVELTPKSDSPCSRLAALVRRFLGNLSSVVAPGLVAGGEIGGSNLIINAYRP